MCINWLAFHPKLKKIDMIKTRAIPNLYNYGALPIELQESMYPFFFSFLPLPYCQSQPLRFGASSQILLCTTGQSPSEMAL